MTTDAGRGKRIGQIAGSLAGPLGSYIGGKLGAAYDTPPVEAPATAEPPAAVAEESAPGQAAPDIPLEGTPAEQVQALLQAAFELLAAEPDPTNRAALTAEATSLASLYAKLTEGANGLIRIDDNTIIPRSQLETMAPEERAQLEAMAADRQAQIDNEYAAVTNKYGLERYDAERSRVNDINATRTQDFQNALSEADQGLQYDTFDLNQAVQNVQRSLSGLGESRDRTKLVTDTTLAAAPYATNGKTSFTPRDLGAGVQRLAGTGGIKADEVFANFPGTTRIDPQGLLNANDAMLGVTGPLPSLPMRTENRRPVRPELLTPDAVFPEFIAPTKRANPLAAALAPIPAPSAGPGAGMGPSGTDFARPNAEGLYAGLNPGQVQWWERNAPAYQSGNYPSAEEAGQGHYPADYAYRNTIPPTILDRLRSFLARSATSAPSLPGVGAFGP